MLGTIGKECLDQSTDSRRFASPRRTTVGLAQEEPVRHEFDSPLYQSEAISPQRADNCTCLGLIDVVLGHGDLNFFMIKMWWLRQLRLQDEVSAVVIWQCHQCAIFSMQCTQTKRQDQRAVSEHVSPACLYLNTFSICQVLPI